MSPITPAQREQLRDQRAAEREQLAAAHAREREQRAAQAADVRFPQTDAARAQLRAGLSAQRQRQRAARILDEQRAERAAVRAARADLTAARAAGGALTLASAAGPNLQALAAVRRDQYRAALSYPMMPAEVLQAARTAVSSCGHNPDTDDTAADTVGLLVEQVIARHGRQPLRCDVGRDWLRQRAHWTYERESYRRERSARLRDTAALAARWAAEDRDSGSADPSGPDAHWYLAANVPAPAEREQPLPAAAIAERLQLSPKQADALTLALDSEQRVTAGMSGAARKAAADARAILRKRFPTADALRWAMRPLRAAAAAVDACKLTAARRWQPMGPNRPATVPHRTATGYVPAALTLPQPHRERPGSRALDIGTYPLAVALRSGPRWHPVLIASDPKRPALGDPAAVRGARPHSQVRYPAAAPMRQPDPELTASGWGFIERDREHRAAAALVPLLAVLLSWAAAK